jgi:23S rRNA pseudouridine2605 synthase
MSHRPNRHQSSEEADDRGERLQKVLAAAGVASRRECEQIILEGRVEVDGETVTQLGTRVHPSAQQIRVDGVALPRPKLEYYLINKPQGVVTTSRDPWARTRAIDLAPERAGRVFAVGRLDMSSEGLVLLTNDGELANRLAHPRYGIEKTYMVQVAGDVSHDVLEKLRHGVWLAEGRVQPERVFISRRYKNSTILDVVLREGKNREVRRILAALGHKVQRLRRVAIGPLRLGDLPLGQARALTHDELRRLKDAAYHPPRQPQGDKPDGGEPAGPPHKKGRPRYPWKKQAAGTQQPAGTARRPGGKPRGGAKRPAGTGGGRRVRGLQQGRGGRPGGDGSGSGKPGSRGRRNRPR